MGNRTRPSKRLTAREKALIALVAEGYSSAEIGRLYSRSAWTIYQWRTAANAKVGARNPAQLVHLAHSAGVLPLNPRALQALLKRIDEITQ